MYNIACNKEERESGVHYEVLLCDTATTVKKLK